MHRATLHPRLAGLSGLVGALLFFAGDMLFYGHFGSGADFPAGLVHTVTHASDARLYAGGLVGPFAACLCILGFWQVSRNVLPPQGFAARFLFVLFAILMIFGGAIHALWTAHGLSLKYCYGSDDAGCRAVLQTVRSYWSLSYYLGAASGVAASVLLAVLVLFRKTSYPRWTVLFNPALLVFLSTFAPKIPAPLGAVIVGGSANLSIALFFFICLLTMPRATRPGSSPAPA